MTSAENLLGHLIDLPPLWRWEKKQVLRLDIPMNKVALSQKLESAGELLQEVTSDNLVQTRVRDYRVLAGDIMRRGVGNQPLPLLDEQRKVAQFTVLHDEIDMGGRLNTVVERDDVRVPERLQNLDFAIQVLFQLLVKAAEFDGLDGDQSTSNLQQNRDVSQKRGGLDGARVLCTLCRPE